MLVDFIMRAWCKSGTRNLGTRDPSQSLKVGPQHPVQNLKVGPQGPPGSLKVGPPHLSLMNSFFSEYFIVFFLLFIFVSFLSNTKKYQLRVTEINRQH